MVMLSWVNKKIKKHYDWKMVAATESYGFFFGLLIASLIPAFVLSVSPCVYGVLFLVSIAYPLYIWIAKK